jgi:hypothetical protein
MSDHDFCETEFNKKARELFHISEKLNDNWNINEKDQKIYLSKKQTISLATSQKKPPASTHDDDGDPSVVQATEQDDLFAVEYHVLFHPSYQVPALYFNAYSGDKNLCITNWQSHEVDF